MPQSVDKVTLTNTNVTLSTTLLADLKCSADSLPIIEDGQALGMNESKNDSVPVNSSPKPAQNLCSKGSKVVHNNNSNNNKEIKNKTYYKTRRGNENFNQKLVVLFKRIQLILMSYITSREELTLMAKATG